MKIEYKGFVIYRDKFGNLRSYKPKRESKKVVYPGNIKDITSQYKKEKKNNKSKLLFDEGLDKNNSKTEIEGAKWLLKKKGGEIKVLKPKSSRDHKGEYNPDYDYNGKLWDWKQNEVSTERAIRNLVKKGARQIKTNAGGIVVDVTKSNIEENKIKEVVRDGMRDTSAKKYLTIIKKGNKIIATYKKGK